MRSRLFLIAALAAAPASRVPFIAHYADNLVQATTTATGAVAAPLLSALPTPGTTALASSLLHALTAGAICVACAATLRTNTTGTRRSAALLAVVLLFLTAATAPAHVTAALATIVVPGTLLCVLAVRAWQMLPLAFVATLYGIAAIQHAWDHPTAPPGTLVPEPMTPYWPLTFTLLTAAPIAFAAARMIRS